MENKHKTFKPFDKVLVKQCDDAIWSCKFYSHWIGDLYEHITTDGIGVVEEDILPYEGNEHLVGTTDEPEEEVKSMEGLMEGDWVMVCDEPKEYAAEWSLRSIMYAKEDEIMIQSVRFAYGDVTGYKYFIRFADFNPENMEETRKHILCVKNGKIVKYKE